MTKVIAKLFGVNEDRANRIWRTAWQSFIGLFLTFILQLINAALDLLNAQATGTILGSISVMVLTIVAATLKNIKDNKEDDVDPGDNQN